MTNDNHHQTLVAGQFGARARDYLASTSHAMGEDLDRMAEIIGTRPPGTVLDLGCGAGHVAFRLAALSQQVMACDLSDEMLAVVQAESQRRGLHNIVTQAGTAEALPFVDASFDWVVSRYSAHHWTDIAAALTEMRRVLRPNGVLLLMDVLSPGTPLPDSWLQCLELLRDASHVRDYSLAEWQALLAQAGFRTNRIQTFRLPLAFGPWIERMGTPSTHVSAIRSLQQAAPREVADHFSFEADGSFSVDTVLIAAEALKGRS